MNDFSFWQLYGEAAKTSVGFFWKAGRAFVLGYAVSAMIQVFVPKKRFAEYMGAADLKSIALATAFGTASSSCSFAALAATYPKKWAKAARERVTEDHPTENDAFDCRRRVTGRRESRMVGHKFVVDWEMVWEEIIIGFTIAGFVAVLVPPGVWETIFLSGRSETLPHWLIVLALSGGAG